MSSVAEEEEEVVVEESQPPKAEALIMPKEDQFLVYDYGDEGLENMEDTIMAADTETQRQRLAQRRRLKRLRQRLKKKLLLQQARRQELLEEHKRKLQREQEEEEQKVKKLQELREKKEKLQRSKQRKQEQQQEQQKHRKYQKKQQQHQHEDEHYIKGEEASSAERRLHLLYQQRAQLIQQLTEEGGRQSVRQRRPPPPQLSSYESQVAGRSSYGGFGGGLSYDYGGETFPTEAATPQPPSSSWSTPSTTYTTGGEIRYSSGRNYVEGVNYSPPEQPAQVATRRSGQQYDYQDYSNSYYENRNADDYKEDGGAGPAGGGYSVYDYYDSGLQHQHQHQHQQQQQHQQKQQQRQQQDDQLSQEESRSYEVEEEDEDVADSMSAQVADLKKTAAGRLARLRRRRKELLRAMKTGKGKGGKKKKGKNKKKGDRRILALNQVRNSIISLTYKTECSFFLRLKELTGFDRSALKQLGFTAALDDGHGGKGGGGGYSIGGTSGLGGSDYGSSGFGGLGLGEGGYGLTGGGNIDLVGGKLKGGGGYGDDDKEDNVVYYVSKNKKSSGMTISRIDQVYEIYTVYI